MFKKQHLFYVVVVVALWLPLFIAVKKTSAQDNANCPVGQGFWQNNPTWPVTQLTLGDQTYSQVELIILFNTPAAEDASLILAQQLIAAKLNAAKGIDSSVIVGVIAQSDATLASYNGRLPYHVQPADSMGQAMVNLSTMLVSYNEGKLTINCAMPTISPTPSPTGTLTTVTPVMTLSPTPKSTAQPGAPIFIVIEGSVQAINVNIITIYNINIQLAPNDPNLKLIRVGDVVHIEGTPNGDTVSANITIIAVTVMVVNVDVNPSTGQVWRDDNATCANPPPPWAPANGWRKRCGNNHPNDDKHDKKHHDEDDQGEDD